MLLSFSLFFLFLFLSLVLSFFSLSTRREYRLTPWHDAFDRSNYPGVSRSHAIGQSVGVKGRRSKEERRRAKGRFACEQGYANVALMLRCASVWGRLTGASGGGERERV